MALGQGAFDTHELRERGALRGRQKTLDLESVGILADTHPITGTFSRASLPEGAALLPTVNNPPKTLAILIGFRFLEQCLSKLGSAKGEEKPRARHTLRIQDGGGTGAL